MHRSDLVFFSLIEGSLREGEGQPDRGGIIHGSGGGTREREVKGMKGCWTGGLNFLISSLQMKGNFGNIKIHLLYNNF